MMQIHEKVHNYIEENGLKQSTVAKQCSIPTSRFYSMMNGKTKMYAEDLRVICYALNISPEIFMDYRTADNTKL